MVSLFLIVSFLANVAGAICGIGGGVVIKPVLDMLQMGEASTINFLSGCTVLSMSLYSVVKPLSAGDSRVEMSTGTPLAIGAAVGGVQAVVLGIITLGTLAYTLCKSRIPTRRTGSKLLCLLIGLALGVMSSFLGIGEKDTELGRWDEVLREQLEVGLAGVDKSKVVIGYEPIWSIGPGKTPAGKEYITKIARFIKEVTGGIVGRALNKKMDNRAVDKLFIALMVLIVAICVYNALRSFAV